MIGRALKCDVCGGRLARRSATDSTLVCTGCQALYAFPPVSNALARSSRPVPVREGFLYVLVRLTIKMLVALFVAVVVPLMVFAAALQPETFDFLQKVVGPLGITVPISWRSKPGTIEEPALTLRELRTFTGDGWRRLDTTPPPGGWEYLDPAAGLEWALDIARLWNLDARLVRIDAARVLVTGLTYRVDGGVEYHLVSPARADEWATAGDEQVGRAHHTLVLRVDKARSHVRQLNGAPDQALPPAFVSSRPMYEVIARVRGVTAFPRPPFGARLMHDEAESWVWEFRAFAASHPVRVRARDGRLVSLPDAR